jgi:hypothetical protein
MQLEHSAGFTLILGDVCQTSNPMLPKQADSRFPTPRRSAFVMAMHPSLAKSAQRESNPHIRRGKAVGCRYIMGTLNAVKRSISHNTRAERRVGVEPTFPRYEGGVFASRSLSAY